MYTVTWHPESYLVVRISGAPSMPSKSTKSATILYFQRRKTLSESASGRDLFRTREGLFPTIEKGFMATYEGLQFGLS